MSIPLRAERKTVAMKQCKITLVVIAFAFLSGGCSQNGPTGPPSVTETSATRPLLSDRVDFIEKYVNFRRQYLELEYAVDYQNNGSGRVAGPSDWDIRILAVVPSETIEEWVSEGATKTSETPAAWVQEVAADIEVDGMTEWYTLGNSITVGLDRETATVAYRNSTNGSD